MQFNEILDHRRSTRAYTGEPVTREELDCMLAAGVRAPNACNAQSWHFFCTIDRAMITGLVPAVYDRGEWLRDVGCAILICTDAAALEARFGKIARERFAVQDTAAAATQILQCATALGLSGCWMGAFDHDNACAYFGVPDGMEPVILLGIGHAVSEPPARPRKPLDEVVTLLGDCGEAVSCSDEPKPYTLRGSMLPGAVFADLHLADASFHNINMAGARFTDINLTGASFGDLCMNETSFGCVDMKNASFENPDLTGTAFRGCTLRNVKLENCDIGGMTIDGIDVAALIEKAKQEQ